MNKKTISIILLVLIILSIVVFFWFKNKDKEYFDRTYYITVNPDKFLSYGIKFNKNKKFTYYSEQEGKKEIIYSGNYYYDKKEKVIHIEYIKDNEKWTRTLNWYEADSNKSLLFPFKLNGQESLVVFYLREK